MKKKKYLDSQPVSIRFPKGQIAHLKQIARKLAAIQNKDITYADIIRSAVENTHPYKKKPHAKNP